MLTPEDVAALGAVFKPQFQLLLDRIGQVDQKVIATQIALARALDIATEGVANRDHLLGRIVESLENPVIPYEGEGAIQQDFGLRYEEAALLLAKSFRLQFGMKVP